MSDNIPTPLNGAERSIERQLHELIPAPHGIERDTLMFRVGQQSVQRQARLWRALSMMLAATMGILAVSHTVLRSKNTKLHMVRIKGEHEPRVSVPPTLRISSVPQTTWTETRWPQATGSGFLSLRERLILQGLDALPEPVQAAPSTDVPVSLMDWLRQYRTGTGWNTTKLLNDHSNLGDPS